MPPMKRIVICFDGTWKLPWDQDVSNIEKVARTVSSLDGDVEQVVHYVHGVGSSYRVDRLLGGGIGLGISALIMGAYRFLALNYRTGDQLYVFGFSRGAFAARSLVGMIHRVGLVQADALDRGVLKDAYGAYRRTRRGKPTTDQDRRFREHCHDHVCVPFVGVFDTVEALGPRARFHNIDFLGDLVAVGRQALAVDDRRRVFRPRLWESDDQALAGSADPASGRVQQLWFRGCHSDVGGGVANTGLPDAALVWMVREARKQGLRFDDDLLVRYLLSDESHAFRAQVHPSLTLLYRAANAVMYVPWATSWRAFTRHGRVLSFPRSIGVGLSSSAEEPLEDDRHATRNLSRWRQSDPAPVVTEVQRFPVSDDAVLRAALVPAGTPPDVTPMHPCPVEGCAIPGPPAAP